MADALIKQIEKEGYQVIVTVYQRPSINVEQMKEILSTQCAGVFSLINVDEDAIELCEKNNTPITLIGSKSVNPYASTFTVNDYQGSRLIGERLLQLNAAKPCFLCPIDPGVVQNRQRGIEDVFKERKGPKLDIYFESFENDIYNIFANQILKNNNDYVVAYSDEIAINVKRILHLHAKYVYGFDGIHKQLPIISEVNGLSNDWGEEVKDAVADMMIKIQNSSRPTGLDKVYLLSL